MLSGHRHISTSESVVQQLVLLHQVAAARIHITAEQTVEGSGAVFYSEAAVFVTETQKLTNPSHKTTNTFSLHLNKKCIFVK